jgi:hypothetical protein
MKRRMIALKIFVLLMVLIGTFSTQELWAGRSANPNHNKGPRYNDQLPLPYYHYLGDFNNDGIAEWLVIGIYFDHLYVYKVDFHNTPVMDVNVTPILTQDSGTKKIIHIIVGDFKGFGYDQVLLESVNYKFYLYDFYNGSSVYLKGMQRPYSGQAIVGDFNGDYRDEFMFYVSVYGDFNFKSYNPATNQFEVTPNMSPGNIPTNMAHCRVRAGDFSGDGRDDLIFINPDRQLIVYASVNDRGTNTFWWCFNTNPDTVYATEEVSVARVRDCPQDDLIFHDDTYGNITFVRPEWDDNNWGYPVFFYQDPGQIFQGPNTQLFWATLKYAPGEPGGKNRSDALVYRKDYGLFRRSDARWSKTKSAYTYWFAFQQYPPKN